MDRPRMIGRYAVYDQIAAGGMGTIHLGRIRGAVGAGSVVAIKRLHPENIEHTEFVAMFLDEARVTKHINHPNVVRTLDVVAAAGEVLIVLEYVTGATLAELGRQAEALGERIPIPILSTIISGMLRGLHAAHKATDGSGECLNIVHRDISPQNVIVGTDGSARVLDFGVAKAAGRLQTSQIGQLKGKLSYMAPEQVNDLAITPRSDVYATAVLLWNLLTGQRLFAAPNEASILELKMLGKPVAPSEHAADVPPALDELVLRCLALDPDERSGSALEMATALDAAAPGASAEEVAEWMRSILPELIAERTADVAAIEREANAPDADTGISAPTITVVHRDRAAAHVLAVTSTARALRQARESHPSIEELLEIAAEREAAPASFDDSKVTAYDRPRTAPEPALEEPMPPGPNAATSRIHVATETLAARPRRHTKALLVAACIVAIVAVLLLVGQQHDAHHEEKPTNAVVAP